MFLKTVFLLYISIILGLYIDVTQNPQIPYFAQLERWTRRPSHTVLIRNLVLSVQIYFVS